MSPRSSSVRLLCRTGTAALLAAGVALMGAPAAAADEARPVVSLDPPDAAVFLIPTENFTDSFGAGAASTGAEDASVALAQAAAVAPPEIAQTLGVGGVTVASHLGNGEVDVEYGGTVVVRLPPLVTASVTDVSLDVFAADPEDVPRTYSSDPAAVDQLAVTDLGGNEFSVTLPADDSVFGPEAYLTFDALASTEPGITDVFPLSYYLGFTGTGAGTVTLEPSIGVFASASCAMDSAVPCPATDVRAGESFDLTVPPSSLLRTLDFGRLDTAEVGLLGEDDD
jgi:hypothetical protein